MGGLGSGRHARSDGYFNCREAAKMLNVTANDVYRRVKDGTLVPDKTVGENYFFTAMTISMEKARSKREATERGEGYVFTSAEAVGVYKGLSEGKTLEQLVVQLNAHPFAVTKMVLDKIARLNLEGHFPLSSDDELYQVLHLASKEKTCDSCDHHKATLCRVCLKKSSKDAERKAVLAERKRAKADREAVAPAQPVHPNDEPLEPPPDDESLETLPDDEQDEDENGGNDD
jgi:hypothetical protein